MKLPHQIKPCNNCPFRKDSLKGWLKLKIEEIVSAKSFTCHKTDKTLQCAGHMLLLKNNNSFYRLTKRLKLPLHLKGENLVFDSVEECIKHHKYEEK